MTNYPFTSIEDCRDIESINTYKELTEAGILTKEEMMSGIAAKGRDNARTPMQWDDSKNAGFSGNTPWINVNPNYKTINAKAELADANSVFHYYKKLIALRRNSKWTNVIVYGTYRLLDEDNEKVFSYIRQSDDKKLMIICNMSNEEVDYQIAEPLEEVKETVISNYEGLKLASELMLPPWFAGVYEI